MPRGLLPGRRLGGASGSQGAPREAEVWGPPPPSLSRAGAGLNFPTRGRQSLSASTRAPRQEPRVVGEGRVSPALWGGANAVLTRSAMVKVVRPGTGVSGVVDGVPHT